MSIFGNGIYNYRDNYIMNEAYVGKTKTLMEIEEQVGKIRENLGFFKSISLIAFLYFCFFIYYFRGGLSWRFLLNL